MKKKRSTLLIILLAIALIAYFLLPSPDKTAKENAPYSSTKTSQTATPSSHPSGSATIAILSVNDMHSAIDNMPKFAALADSLREVYPNLLIFSAGDNRTGNPINDQYDPVNGPMISLMNAVGFDLSAVGNHEWDGGVAALQQNIKDADFPFLCANVNLPSDITLDVKPYTVIENQGVKIAVVSLIEVRASGIPGAHPKNFTNISFRQPFDVVADYQYLREQNDVMIYLTHLGFEEDMELAQKCPYLDEIIGGHSHTFVEQPQYQDGVLITQAGSSLRCATLSLLTVKEGKVVAKEAMNFDLEHRTKINRDIQAMLDGFNSDTRFREALSTAVTPFDTKEELGCLITDAIREVSEADFAFTNTGGIRVNNLKKGPLTIKDVYNIDPFNNEIVVYTMTGRQLERYIMESFKKNGRYPSPVSGMSYKVNTDSERYPKSVNIKLDNGKFSYDAQYTVAMNSYVASTVRFESVDDGKDLFMTSEEMMIEYLRNHKKVSYQGVSRVE